MPGSPLTHAARRLRAAARPADPAADRDLLARYAAAADPEAFAELVRRHARAVLAACRQVLPAEADVEDAFQATFLALARNARRVRCGPDLGGWLFAVAHRTAVRAARTRARAARWERAAARPEAVAPDARADPSWREAVGVLHEELDRLPDALRLPLLLCYLEGLSRDEAAARLGVGAETVRGRLERGRERLRRRLTRRGVTLSAGLLSAVTCGDAPAASLDLVAATLRVAGGAAPAAVDRLATAAAGGVVTRAKVLLGLVVVTGASAGFLVAGAGPLPADPPTGVPKDRAPAPPAIQPAPPAIPVRGVVLDPTGKPVPGAKLVVFDDEAGGPAPQPATGPDGRFAFDLPPAQDAGWRTVLASATGLGVGWVKLKADPVRDTVVRLVPDVPVTGRVIDLEGRPVAGATVDVHVVHDG